MNYDIHLICIKLGNRRILLTQLASNGFVYLKINRKLIMY